MKKILLLGTALMLALGTSAFGTSHREAPGITRTPLVDGTDLYMFRSYEVGREDFVTLIANYNPAQLPGAGPNYFALDEDARYNIHIDNDGDALADITFRFEVDNQENGLQLTIGPAGDTRTHAAALKLLGPISAADTISPETSATQNFSETFTVTMITRNPDGTLTEQAVTNAADGSAVFAKPNDNVGTKSIPDYAAYAANFIYDINIPGASQPGRLFVGQRKEAFVIPLGRVFDLVNLAATEVLGPEDNPQIEDFFANLNIDSFVIEAPVDFLTNGNGDPVIGAWTDSQVQQVRIENPNPIQNALQTGRRGGAFTVVSRLGNALFNELIMGLGDKDLFNASRPEDDAGNSALNDYVTHPTLPAILAQLFPVQAPLAPRDDLVQVFLTGVPGLNQPQNVVPAEMMRLNTSIPPTPAAQQSRLGVLGNKVGVTPAEQDLAGTPNGRRPGDDIVDITLRVAMGVLLINPDGTNNDAAPSGNLAFTDGTFTDAFNVDDTFPYLRTPLPGAVASP